MLRRWYHGRREHSPDCHQEFARLFVGQLRCCHRCVGGRLRCGRGVQCVGGARGDAERVRVLFGFDGVVLLREEDEVRVSRGVRAEGVRGEAAEAAGEGDRRGDEEGDGGQGGREGDEEPGEGGRGGRG